MMMDIKIGKVVVLFEGSLDEAIVYTEEVLKDIEEEKASIYIMDTDYLLCEVINDDYETDDDFQITSYEYITLM